MSAGSLAILAVAYIVFWGCAWGSARAPYAPAALPLVGDDAVPTTVGGSLQPAAPQSAASVYVVHRLDEHHEVFAGAGAGVGLSSLSGTPFAGLRLHFDVATNLRIGLEVSAYLEGGMSLGLLTFGEGPYLQPGLGVGMPLAWRMYSWDIDDLAPVTFTLFTDPAVFAGPAWGPAPALSEREPHRVGLLRLPIGVAVQLERFHVYVETGGQGTMSMGARHYQLPVPFPYLALGGGWSF